MRGIGSLRQIAIEIGLRLLKRRFERTTVEREQDLTRLYVVAFCEVDAGQLASCLGTNRHAREGFGRADDTDLDRHRLLDDRADRDGYRPATATAASPSSARRR